jgi:multidrug efflux pump subunit AcrA (membrane-fusion protein)
VADATPVGWRRQVRRPVVIGAIVVIGALVIGGATAWAAGGSGSSGYRTATVVRASIAQRLDVVGTVEPVSDASPAFQVGGQVTSVHVAVGATVTAGEILATLDPTALTQSVSSAQSTVESDQAKLTEDEDGQTSSAATTSDVTSDATSATAASAASLSSEASTPVVTTQALVVSSATGTITQDQATLVADQQAESTDQQTEAADMTQSDSVCGLTTTPPSPPADPSSCAAALAKVSGDEQTIANDQQKVNADESALAKALTAEQSSLPTSGSGGSGSSGGAGSSGSSGQSSASNAGATGNSGTGTRSGGSTSTATDSAEQIATDQAAIDNAQADLIEAQQALGAAQLTSPIAGTVASVGLTVGDTVTAHSTTSDIVVIGTHSFEVAGTLTSSQVSSVKVGFSADVAVDGTTGSFQGTVSQVGPVQASTSGYSYPVVVVLPASATGLFAGSTADMSIMTQHATDVLAVPTSAVQTEGTSSFVLQMSSGTPVRKVVKTGIVGGIYTQVLSGLQRGTTVVLANLSTPVPASSTTVTGGFGGGGGFGGAGGFTGGGGGRFTQGAAPGGLGG